MISEALKKEIFRRYTKHGFKFNTWKDLKEQTGINEDSTKCYYCKKELNPSDNYPYRNAVSLDHKIPKALGGKNSLDNVVICCCECNIIKGTMNDQTYFLFLNILNQHPKEKEIIFKELFWGRRRNKIKRENKELKLWELI